MSAKKKSLVPLFGVAFIVAIVATGIFYGLFVGRLNSASVNAAAGGKVLVAIRAVPAGSVVKAEQVKEIAWPQPPVPTGSIGKAADAIGQTAVAPIEANQMITRAMLASRDGGGADSAAMGIPDGLRAVSLRVQDSAGVVSLLKAGHRIDVQVIGSLPGFGQEPQLRTVLENMRVLSVPSGPEMGRGSFQVITVLATPKEATVLGLADSSAKIRIALRNPVDQRKENPQAVALGSLFRGGPAPQEAPVGRTANPASVIAPPTAPAGPTVQFLVRMGAVAWQEVDGLEASVIAGESALGGGRINWLSTTRLSAPVARETGAQWVQLPYAVRVRLKATAAEGSRIRLRVSPEVAAPGDSGVYRRSLDGEWSLNGTEQVLVRGLASPATVPALWTKIFPGRRPVEGQELVILIGARSQVAAVTQPGSSE